MGVMACSRWDCENILCSRYSSKYGYICNDCFDELCETENIDLDIEEFMSSSKKPVAPKINFRDYFEHIFINYDD